MPLRFVPKDGRRILQELDPSTNEWVDVPYVNTCTDHTWETIVTSPPPDENGIVAAVAIYITRCSNCGELKQ